MQKFDAEVAEVQVVIDGLRARLEAALAEVGKARIDPTGPGHHKARRWARGEERRYTLKWLRAQPATTTPQAAADAIEAGQHRPEGPHGVPSDEDWRGFLEYKQTGALRDQTKAIEAAGDAGFKRGIEAAAVWLREWAGPMYLTDVGGSDRLLRASDRLWVKLDKLNKEMAGEASGPEGGEK